MDKEGPKVLLSSKALSDALSEINIHVSASTLLDRKMMIVLEEPSDKAMGYLMLVMRIETLKVFFRDGADSVSRIEIILSSVNDSGRGAVLTYLKGKWAFGPEQNREISHLSVLL